MPYTNVPPEKEQKMHDCVMQVQDEGYDEKSAIAICYRSVVDGASLDDAKAELDAQKKDAPQNAETSIQRGEIVALSLPTLNADTPGQLLTLQILRAGEFTDMHGLDLSVTSHDLDAYVARSNATLAAHEIPIEVGHPSDAGAPAAAWYRDFFKQAIDGVEWLCAHVELSALGARALAEQLYKYFSASLDLSNKQIIGGGFVNRPAVSGQLPVGSLAAAFLRLSIHKTGGESQMDEKEFEAKLSAVREEERAKLLAQQQEFNAQLAAAREDERKRVLVEVQRQQEIHALAAQLTSGRKAFWHKPEELEALLGKLTDDDRALVAPLLKEIQSKGLVDLGEIGTSADTRAGKELPKTIQPHLAAFLAKGGSLEEFFAVNVELGEQSAYDLREFADKK